jgi:hypothetical protein
MTTPTIAYGGTTIDLGFVAETGNSREIDSRTIVRRTLDGNLRTTILSMSYKYDLSFNYTLRATYDALVALWRAASAAGAYPLFTFTDAWTTASSVPVGLVIGPLVWTFEDVGSYTLTLTEAPPR